MRASGGRTGGGSRAAAARGQGRAKAGGKGAGKGRAQARRGGGRGAGAGAADPRARQGGARGAAAAKPRVRRGGRGKAAQGAAASKPKVRPRARQGAARGAAAAKPRVRRGRARGAAKPRARHTAGSGKAAAESLRAEIRQYYDASGFLSWSAAAKRFIILGTNEPKGGLVPCPECGLGQLMVVRSRATGKRFVGCSNYYSGCGASSPLLQRARLRALKQPCASCGWPMVIFRYSRNQKWTRQCSNMRCPTRATPAQS